MSGRTIQIVRTTSDSDSSLPQVAVPSTIAGSPGIASDIRSTTVLPPSASASSDPACVWPHLNRYLDGFRNFCSAQESLYMLENAASKLKDPEYKLMRRKDFERLECRIMPLIYNMVNGYFLPLKSYSTENKKRILRQFSTGFSELYSYWLSAKAFPEVDDGRLATHFGYYVDANKLEDFFLGSKDADQHIKLTIPLLAKCRRLKRKYETLAIDELEVVALVGILLFRTIDALDLTLPETRTLERTIIHELNSHLVARVGPQESGIRMGNLMMYYQDLMDLLCYYKEYVVMGRVFLSSDFIGMWDEESAFTEHIQVD